MMHCNFFGLVQIINFPVLLSSKITSMPSRTTELLLDDIVHASDKILMYTRGMSYYDFSADDKTVDAVVRNIEIISEAVDKIPEQYKSAHPEIDWNSIVNYANRTVVDTSIINYEMAWKIREEDASTLLEQVSALSNENKRKAY